jgi:hypothetical protein
MEWIGYASRGTVSTCSPSFRSPAKNTVHDPAGQPLPAVARYPPLHVGRNSGVQVQAREGAPGHRRAVSLLAKRLRRHEAGRVHGPPELAVVDIGVLGGPVPMQEHSVPLVAADDETGLVLSSSASSMDP